MAQAMNQVMNHQALIKGIIRGNNYKITGSNVLNIRYCNDVDIICYKEDILIETTGDEYIQSAIIDNKKYEFLLADNQEVLQEILKDKLIDEKYVYAILKRGHLHIARRRDEEWYKHISDYHILKNIYDLNQSHAQHLIKLAIKTTNQRIKQSTPKLKGVTKDKFFDDYVKKYYIHDDLHKLVAYDKVPAYTKMQKDDTVECHKDLWNHMSYLEKCQAVSEEAIVICLERHMIPQAMENRIGKPMFLAYKWAIMRICTTLCSGWFRDFAIENFFTVLNMYNEVKLNEHLTNILKNIKYGGQKATA